MDRPRLCVYQSPLWRDSGTATYISIPDNSSWWRLWNGSPVPMTLPSTSASSPPRPRGFNHSLAFWVDPGWAGRLTMEISNVTQHRPLLLTKGMKFAQLVFYQLDRPAEKPYDGRYKGDAGVQMAKGEV